MDRLARLAGALGASALALAPFAWFALGGRWGGALAAQAGIGALLLGLSLFYHRDRLARPSAGRGAFFLAFSALAGLGLLALLAALNIGLSRAQLELDLTAESLHTLDPASVEAAQALQGEVEILAFYGPASREFAWIESLVQGYQRHSPHLRLRALEPSRHPELVERYGVRLEGRRLLLRAGDRVERAAGLEEADLTAALLRLGAEARPKVYALTGHGEGALDDSAGPRGLATLAQALDEEGIDAAPFSLLSGEPLPSDAAALIVAGPQRPLLDAELEALIVYLDMGGRLLLLLDPGVDANLRPLLDHLAVQAEDDLLLDAGGRLAERYGPAVVAGAQFTAHPITEGFTAAVAFPTARSLTPLRLPGQARPTPLVLSGEASWGETDYTSEAAVGLSQGERQGPLPLVVLGETPTEGRYLVFGDADLAGNQWLPLLGNRDLLLNSLGWLAALDDRPTLRPRRRAASRLIFLSRTDEALLRLGTLDLLPLALAAVGLAIWLRRRTA